MRSSLLAAAATLAFGSMTFAGDRTDVDRVKPALGEEAVAAVDQALNLGDDDHIGHGYRGGFYGGYRGGFGGYRGGWGYRGGFYGGFGYGGFAYGGWGYRGWGYGGYSPWYYPGFSFGWGGYYRPYYGYGYGYSPYYYGGFPLVSGCTGYSGLYPLARTTTPAATPTVAAMPEKLAEPLTRTYRLDAAKPTLAAMPTRTPAAAALGMPRTVSTSAAIPASAPVRR